MDGPSQSLSQARPQLGRQYAVLDLLRDQLTDRSRAQLNALGENDWLQIIQSADRLGVAPLLLGNARRLAVGVPAPVGAQLRKILTDNSARNLKLLAEFARLADALQAQGIPFMPLKGVYLCSNLYENIGERPIWDIDLIVHRSDLRRALQVIETTGYRASRPYDLEIECSNYHHVPVYLKAGAPPLEIHWTLLNPRFQHTLDLTQVWERSVPARVGDTAVQVLSAGDLLIYLCAHVAYQHVYMDSVRALYDIKLVLLRLSGQLDWGEIAQRAREWGLLNSVYLSLRLAADALGCPLPDFAWLALRPDGFNERLIQAALARILENTGASPVMNAVWAKQSPLQRLKGLWGRILVPRSILAARYGLPPNSRWVNWYYLVRARDLLRIHGGNLLHLWFGGQQHAERARRDSELVAYLGWWQ